MEGEHGYRPNVEDKLYYFRKLKEGGEGVEEGDFEMNMEELREFAKGEGEKETREQWYPGWTKQDFERLIQKLENEGIVE
ncbi:MAG: hypothetical protein UU48_C0027G0007 [Candidatus Uhrbacteria bacterium GW2011_GWF2_41_16]|jgi:hypothetical protein|uniref:Uncharacterized protein n=2 Tax=Candidatus Uhriibacteriota TaxID=1752732 RepID=A0A0G0V6Y9_9BACT|nr:MAG: hypothetical protein UU35_C0024G0006 [Candidatus Uhrbacteria bacterium GW2011_GWC2_41_11]KKR96699.1 MAG: hypothetical protein UU48_C0027G0007 [Candidatus Uhrbacteria bacterium GW2011_GWF2_41_16]HBP00495.1 hypothetical protein [Candidatus Uhrbacteria bacterium]